MKKLFLISIILGIALNSFSQLEFFFPDSNSCFSVSTYKFWFHGDTVINKLKYKKIFMQENEITADLSKANYYAALREDTLTERIYCIQKEDSIERLLYDFSLQKGDTVSIYTFWPLDSPYEIKVYVERVDSVLIDNNYRKRIILENSLNSEYWIEGIGSTNGVLFPSSIIVDAPYPKLLCVSNNGNFIYKDSHANDCYEKIWIGIPENNIKIKVFPTLVKESIFFELEEDNVVLSKYSIINAEGKKIKEGIIESSKINVSSIDKGNYVIIISDESFRKLYATKFTKL